MCNSYVFLLRTNALGANLYYMNSTATAKLETITKAWSEGRTVYIQTAMRVTVLSAKTAAKFAAAGRPVVKIKGDSLYVIEGKRYVCADYCAISIA